MISSLEVYAFNLKKILKNTYIYITYIYLYLHVYQNIIIKIYNYVLNNILNYIMLDKKALILNSYFWKKCQMKISEKNFQWNVAIYFTLIGKCSIIIFYFNLCIKKFL